MKMIICSLSAFLVFALPCFSQEIEQNRSILRSRHAQSESPDDAYMPVPEREQHTSPSYRYSGLGVVTAQVNVSGDGDNIIGDAANEPTIAVDPQDHARMAICWRQFDTILSNFRQAGRAYTRDSGQTWTFPGVIEPGVFRSDPVLDYDIQGNFYFNSLADSWVCSVFKSTDGGATWDAGTFAQGGDKQWMTIDRTVGIGRGNIYACWNGYYSVCEPGNFTRSTDGGLSYEDCSYIPEEPYWGVLTVGNDGEVYVCGAAGTDFIVLRSTDAKNPDRPVTWDLATPVSLGGEIGYGGGPNPGGLLGQAWIAVDHSSGPTRGNVYLLCSVTPASSGDPLEVMFSRSTDGGTTWSEPVRINDDSRNDAWQWFGTMSVAPNGRIDVIWLDTRDSDALDSALYYSYSEDGGLTWSANRRLSELFDPHVGWPQQQKMGDYFHMISDSGGADLAWAATFNGEEDVYYSRITAPSAECLIAVIAPSGGETLCTGETADITWTSANTSGNVKIDYSTDGGSHWHTISAGTFDDGSHPWTLPDVSSADCLVKICDVSDASCCDRSSGTFQICECGTIGIAAQSPPSGTEGCPYNETIEVTGGCHPFSWSIVSGALPDGLDLDDSGTISGDPKQLGIFSFTVHVADVLGNTDNRAFSINVNSYADFKCDVNADCAVNVVDVVAVVNIILRLFEPTQDEMWRADCNGQSGDCSGDGIVNILDAVKIINVLLHLDECPAAARRSSQIEFEIQ